MKFGIRLLALAAVVSACCLGGAGLRAEEPQDGPPLKEIKMYASNWQWSPDVIRVEQGTLLRIVVENVDSTHRFDLKEYKLKVNLPQDQTTTVEFLANKPGEFRWRCGRPCGNGCPKMVGTLIVAAPEGE